MLYSLGTIIVSLMNSEAIYANLIAHTAKYYKTSISKVGLHCIAHSSSQRAASWPACEESEDLWLMLLDYDGGCKEGAQHFGLTNFADAFAFCSDEEEHCQLLSL